jgi:ABC-2 type transport system permease protein
VISDLLTVAWKEWRSLGGHARRQLAITGGIIGIFWAIVFPIQVGRDWVTDPVPLVLVSLVLPLVVVGVVVPDAIAGERERHTLSTLLASRLPDRAILFGKLGFAVLLGCLSTLLLMLVSLVVVNLTAGTGELLMFDLGVLAWLLTFSLLIGIMTGGIAVFVSLRARTAQEAQQLTLIGLMLPFTVIGFGLTFLLADRELARSLFAGLTGLDLGLTGLGVMLIVAVVDLAIVAAADRRFRRGRLT